VTCRGFMFEAFQITGASARSSSRLIHRAIARHAIVINVPHAAPPWLSTLTTGGLTASVDLTTSAAASAADFG
jgi:hypothetical protein